MTAYITNQVSLVAHLFPEGIEVVATQNCNFKTCINQNLSQQSEAILEQRTLKSEHLRPAYMHTHNRIQKNFQSWA